MARLVELEALWQRERASALSVYEVLRDVVLPAARSGEVFLYAAPLVDGTDPRPSTAPTIPPRPRSVGAELARWAVAAGRVDDLRKLIAERQAKPRAELPAQVLISLIAQAEAASQATVSSLDAIGRKLEKDSLEASAELACHAALPALAASDIATARAAVTVLDRASKALAGGTAEEPIDSLILTLARFAFDQRNAPEGRKRIEELLAIAERAPSRTAGDDLLYRRKRAYAASAFEYLRAGLEADSLDLLGQFADLPALRGGDPSSGATLVAPRQAARWPAGDRYDRLKAWTLPAPARRSVRLVAAFVDTESPGPDFPGGVADTASLLVAAARAADKLDALADEVRSLADLSAENAIALLIVVESARGRGGAVEPLARGLAAGLTGKWPVKSRAACPYLLHLLEARCRRGPTSSSPAPASPTRRYAPWARRWLAT